MTHQETVLISKPIEEVWAAFNDPEELKKWQPSIQSFEHQSGDPGEVGARTKIVAKEGGKTIEMTETITSRKEFEELTVLYDAGDVNVTAKNLFKAQGDETEWTLDAELELSGPLSIFAGFVRGKAVARIRADMRRLKKQIEAK